MITEFSLFSIGWEFAFSSFHPCTFCADILLLVSVSFSCLEDYSGMQY